MLKEVALSVFCLKTVRYCMYMWLPMYLLKRVSIVVYLFINNKCAVIFIFEMHETVTISGQVLDTMNYFKLGRVIKLVMYTYE